MLLAEWLAIHVQHLARSSVRAPKHRIFGSGLGRTVLISLQTGTEQGRHMPPLTLSPIGALAQLGERLICIQEVIGSIPIGSTTSSSHREDDERAGRRSLAISERRRPVEVIPDRDHCRDPPWSPTAVATPSGLRPRHMPQNDPPDRFVRRSRNGMWVGSSGG